MKRAVAMNSATYIELNQIEASAHLSHHTSLAVKGLEACYMFACESTPSLQRR